MAKLKGLFDKIASLEEQLAICNRAYMDMLEKYQELYQKYSYQETMERVKIINEERNINRKNII